MIMAAPSGNGPLAEARLFKSASADCAIPSLGIGNAFAASWESGSKTFCGIMSASTS
jgi:hypothetical protein